MDANGTRFHLLLGRADWGRCTSGAMTLAEAWDASPPGDAGIGVAWDDKGNAVTLAPLTPRFIAAKGDVPPSLESRRGAARDAFGNTYWIDDTRKAIRVVSAGNARPSRFWPDDAPLRCDTGDFAPVTPAQPRVAELAGLAVTDDHYLVVGTLAPAGLLVFDLHAVGEPVSLEWPRGVAFAPYDMAPRPGGGVVVLDRRNRRVWTLDRNFAVVPDSDAVELKPSSTEDFQPVSGASRVVAARRFQQGVGFDPASPLTLGDVIAIETLEDGTVLLLERDGGKGFARIAAYRGGRMLGEPVSLDLFAAELEEDSREGFRLIGHDMALLRTAGAANQADVFVVSAGGNQSFALTAEVHDDGLALRASRGFYPMRRFGGKSLAVGGGSVFYDFSQTWIPLVAQRVVRYVRHARIVSPPLDSELPDCVWHRLLVDACVPPGAELGIESRAADEKVLLATAPWQTEPPLHRRPDGGELPWLRIPFDDNEAGCFELLFQRARGRYLQVRLTLDGNERATPHIARLRNWFPRFSYLERYLPAIYREDAASASFLDRYLANVEGIYTAVEDRIAAAQILFDPRSAPPEALAWLAGWFGVALDPAWDERRQRLFIRHAVTFFHWRGTVHGLRMALALAFDACIEEAALNAPVRQPARPHDIRIVERFMTRRFTPLALGEPLELAGPRSVAVTPAWTPAEGAARLHQRYADTIGTAGAVFPLVAPEDGAQATAWRNFCATTLGFLPAAAGQQRALWQAYLARTYRAADDQPTTDVPPDLPAPGIARTDWRHFLDQAAARELRPVVLWQAFLARRYRRIRALDTLYGTHWERFEEVAFPDRLPADGAALVDWHGFESTVMAMQATSHRFSVLVPTPCARADRARSRERLELARRIVALEKPAHTVFNVGLYWALFRVGEARLGLDTVLEAGSRAPDLLPPVVLGLDYVGESHLDRSLPTGRQVLECA
jgi:phage tail-like protein